MGATDPYAGMPLYLRQAAQRNLNAVDRSNAAVNIAGQRTATPVASAAPIPIPAPAPPPASALQLNLGGAIDTSIGSALPSATAVSRVTPSAAPSENFGGHMINPKVQTGAYSVNSGAYATNPAAYGQVTNNPSDNRTSSPDAYKTNPAAYHQTTFKPSQSYQDYEARKQKLRSGYGHSAAYQEEQ